MMKVVCAECKGSMGEKMGPDGLITHGICHACMAKLYPDHYVHPEFKDAYARNVPDTVAVLDVEQKKVVHLTVEHLAVELVRYRCRKCGDEVKNADLRETDGLLEHPNEGEYDGESWHQLWCGPVEELPTQREIHRLDEQASAGPEDEDDTEEDDSDGVDEDEHADDCDCEECVEDRAVERENAEEAR